VEEQMTDDKRFANPIHTNGADPWFYQHTDGYYYYTHTTGDNVTIWKSKTITGIRILKEQSYGHHLK
jgi:GH43 family beta-xylosidase